MFFTLPFIMLNTYVPRLPILRILLTEAAQSECQRCLMQSISHTISRELRKKGAVSWILGAAFGGSGHHKNRTGNRVPGTENLRPTLLDWLSWVLTRAGYKRWTCGAFPRCRLDYMSCGQAAAVLFTKRWSKNTAALTKLCEENSISFVKLGKFHNIRSAWRHETLLKISRLLPAIKMQLATSDDSELQHVCTEHFQCLVVKVLDIGNILKTTSIRFQREKLTTGECKDEFTLTLQSDACRWVKLGPFSWKAQ